MILQDCPFWTGGRGYFLVDDPSCKSSDMLSSFESTNLLSRQRVWPLARAYEWALWRRSGTRIIAALSAIASNTLDSPYPQNERDSSSIPNTSQIGPVLTMKKDEGGQASVSINRPIGCHFTLFSITAVAILSRFLLPIAHCTLQSLTGLKYWNGGVPREFQWHTHVWTLPFQYFYHVSDCSVQCAIGARNHETTVRRIDSATHHYSTLMYGHQAR